MICACWALPPPNHRQRRILRWPRVIKWHRLRHPGLAPRRTRAPSAHTFALLRVLFRFCTGTFLGSISRAAAKCLKLSGRPGQRCGDSRSEADFWAVCAAADEAPGWRAGLTLTWRSVEAVRRNVRPIAGRTLLFFKVLRCPSIWRLLRRLLHFRRRSSPFSPSTRSCV